VNVSDSSHTVIAMPAGRSGLRSWSQDRTTLSALLPHAGRQRVLMHVPRIFLDLLRPADPQTTAAKMGEDVSISVEV
jgi:hypothetical protein